MRLLASIFVLTVFNAFADVIPSDRLVTWQGNVGIPGGIPNRTTIFKSLTDLDNTGTTNVAPALGTNLIACPSNQVVYLPAGTYKLDGEVIIPSFVTLRGVGTNTILNFTGTSTSPGYGMLSLGTNDGWTYIQNSSGTSITGGATKGSTNITVSSASGMVVGGYLNIDSTDDGTIVTNNGLATADGVSGCTCGARAGRHLSQIVEITGVSGTSINFAPPLYSAYANSPEAVNCTMKCKWGGVENLKLVANNNGINLNVQMFACAYCWIKNVESSYSDGDHAWVMESYRCEIRDCDIHDGFNHSAGSHDDTVIIGHSSGCLVENNIFRRLHCGVMFKEGGGGHVCAYNFVTNTFGDNSLGLMPDLDFHGLYVQQVLFEGNSASTLSQDSIWGPSGSCTALRNYLSGDNWVNWSGSYQRCDGSLRVVNLGYSTYNFNIVGNVLGRDMSTNGGTPMRSYPQLRTWNEPEIFSLGYGYGSDNGGPEHSNDWRGAITLAESVVPTNTTIIHGNWDSINHAQTWSTNADHAIPQSYYLASKPAWFGNMTWPPFDPSAGASTGLPAQYRFTYGTNPPSSTAAARKVNRINAKQIIVR